MAQRYIIDTSDPNRATLYASPLSTLPISLAGQVRNDKVLALTIEPMVPNTTGASPLLLPDYEVTDTFQVAIGLADLAPTAGTFALTVAGSTTGMTALPFDITAAALETVFNAAMAAHGPPYPKATITKIGDTTFRIIANLTGAAYAAIPTATVVPASTNLVPTCDAFVSEVFLGSAGAPYRLTLVIRQSAVALSAPATPLPSTTVVRTNTQALSATTNAIDTISFTGADPISGTFILSASAFGLTKTFVVPFNMSAEDLQSMLEDADTGHPYLIGNVSVRKSGMSFVVEFINSLGPRRILTSSIANPTVITTEGEHGFPTGISVTHSSTNSTPNTDGAQVASVTAVTTYTVPVNVTTAGTAGVVRPTTSAALSVSDNDLAAPQGVSGTIDLNTENLWEYSLSEVESEDEFWNMLFSVTRTRASGEVRTIYGPISIQLAKDIVDAATLVPVPLPSYYTSVQSDARYAKLAGNNTFGFGQIIDLTGTSGFETGLIIKADTSSGQVNNLLEIYDSISVLQITVGLDGTLYTALPYQPQAGIQGTGTNDSAATGIIGEIVPGLIATGSATSLSTATAKNVTSIALTAGDWDVEGNINFNLNGATQTQCSGGISSTSATLPTDGSEVVNGQQSSAASLVNGLSIPRKRISIAGNTTVYLVAKATFSFGTIAAWGGITARRVR